MYTYTQLKNFANQVFIKIGCPVAEADIASKTLVSADLRGVDSHGVARLSGYVRLWEADGSRQNKSDTGYKDYP